LEAELGVSNSKTVFSSINFPVKLGNSSFDLVRVFEDHKSLCEEVVSHSLGIFSCEVLFKKIDFIILSDAPFGGPCQVLGGIFVALVFGELLQVSGDLHIICVVVVSWPASNIVGHSFIFGLDSISVDSVDLHDGNVVAIVTVGVF
jgi:hypothetical protein